MVSVTGEAADGRTQCRRPLWGLRDGTPVARTPQIQVTAATTIARQITALTHATVSGLRPTNSTSRVCRRAPRFAKHMDLPPVAVGVDPDNAMRSRYTVCARRTEARGARTLRVVRAHASNDGASVVQ